VEAGAALWVAIGAYLLLRLLCYLGAIVLCHLASRRGSEFEAEVRSLALTLSLRTGPLSAGPRDEASDAEEAGNTPLEAFAVTRAHQSVKA
jgi:hypothetical protein